MGNGTSVPSTSFVTRTVPPGRLLASRGGHWHTLDWASFRSTARRKTVSRNRSRPEAAGSQVQATDGATSARDHPPAARSQQLSQAGSQRDAVGDPHADGGNRRARRVEAVSFRATIRARSDPHETRRFVAPGASLITCRARASGSLLAVRYPWPEGRPRSATRHLWRRRHERGAGAATGVRPPNAAELHPSGSNRRLSPVAAEEHRGTIRRQQRTARPSPGRGPHHPLMPGNCAT